MQNLFKDLEQLLLQCDDYSIDDKLNKPKIEEQALSLEPRLLKILLSHDGLKKHFFQDVDSVLIFDKVKFQKFISNKQFLPDSYTQFKNKIGLTANGTYLTESKEVVLDFPYKDCVLQGCQDKEDVKRNEVFFNETLAPDDIDMLLEPKVLTNFKKYDATGEHKVTELNTQDNLIIKGNNLLALHSLLSVYRGKVKLIYIDPPYNTENDSFGYNDKFNHCTWLTFMKNRLEVAKELLHIDGIICVQCDDKEQAYLKILMDEVFENRFENGMQTRFLNNISVKMSEASGVKMNHAKGRFPKLKEYILIYKMPNFKGFVNIDKYKQSEWDQENNIFIENLTFEQRTDLIEIEAKELNTLDDVIKANEILKNAKKISLSSKLNELKFESDDAKKEWLFNNSYRIIKTAGSSSLASLVKGLDTIPKQDIAAAISKKNVLFLYITDFNKDTKHPRLQVIFSDSNVFKNPCDFWQDIRTTGAISDEGGVKLENGKKPEKILFRLIKMITNKGDIILDYHLGSGTTAAVAHKMGRQYIGIEQLDYIEGLVVTRLKNVVGKVDGSKDLIESKLIYKDFDTSGISHEENWSGGGSFVYCELKQNNQLWADKVINAVDSDELLNIWQIMQDKAQLSYKIDVKTINNSVNDFKLLSLEEQKQFLLEILDKNQLYVNYTEIEDVDYQCSEEEKNLNNIFYGLK